MTHVPDWLIFFERTYPSANILLNRREHSMLVDTGYGSDLVITKDFTSSRPSGVRRIFDPTPSGT